MSRPSPSNRAGALIAISLCALALALFSRPEAGATGATMFAPDTDGDVGAYPSIVLDASGNPVISYGDSQPLSLKLIHCGDPGCASGNRIVTLDPDAGLWSSVRLDAAGHPVIAYLETLHNDLKVIHCGDANCATGNTITSPDTDGLVGQYASLALDAAGYPVVSYRDEYGLSLKVLHCDDAACSAGNTITNVDPAASNVGLFASLALDGAGYPVVSYYDFDNADLKVAHCGDANCSAHNFIVTADSLGVVGWFTSLALDAVGYPVVSYYDSLNGDLKLLHCGDVNCTSANSVTTPDTTGNVGIDTSLALDAAGNPVISFRDATSNDLKVLHCGDPNCSAGNVFARPDSEGFVGELTSLALDATGHPVVSYYDTTHGDLKVLHCADANCSGGVKTTPTPATPCGDASGDGRVNSIDAVLVLQYDAGRLHQLPNAASADTNGDGRINSIDASIILQIDARLLPECV